MIDGQTCCVILSIFSSWFVFQVCVVIIPRPPLTISSSLKTKHGTDVSNKQLSYIFTLNPSMPGLGGHSVPTWIVGKTLLFTVGAAPAVPWQLLLAFLTPKRNEWVFNWSGHFPCEFLAARLFIFTRRKLGLQFVSVWGSKKAIIREISKPRLTWNYSQSYDPPGLASLCRHSLSLS